MRKPGPFSGGGGGAPARPGVRCRCAGHPVRFCKSLELLRERGASLSEVGGLQVRALDATTVKEPGKTGSLWFVHYSVRLLSLACEVSRLTETFELGTRGWSWNRRQGSRSTFWPQREPCDTPAGSDRGRSGCWMRSTSRPRGEPARSIRPGGRFASPTRAWVERTRRAACSCPRPSRAAARSCCPCQDTAPEPQTHYGRKAYDPSTSFGQMSDTLAAWSATVSQVGFP